MSVKIDLSFNELKDMIARDIYSGIKKFKVDKKELIASLEEAIKETKLIHKKSIKLWIGMAKTYAEFIQKHPGSTQMQTPGEIPELPVEVYQIKSHIRLFNSISDDTIDLELSTLQSIFNLATTIVQKSTQIFCNMVSASSGSMNLAHGGEFVLPKNYIIK